MVHALVLLQSTPYPTGFFVCDLCQERGSGAVLHCSACRFDLHPSCIATDPQHSHFSHFQHPLHLLHTDTTSHPPCHGCGELVASPSAYLCHFCNISLHPYCIRAPRFILHPSHKHHLCLTPASEAYTGHCWCDACGEHAFNFVYHCSACKFDLHISCAMLPCHPLHPKHPEHRLTLLNTPANKVRQSLCFECRKQASKWMYGCEACGFYLHALCAKLPGHEVLPPPDPPADASSSDVEAVVKVMDRLLLSSSDGMSSEEASAMRKVMNMLEQQHHCGPITRSSAASIARDESDQQTCPACLDVYDCDQHRRNLVCGHHFHTGCILRWMESSSCCPVCRQQVILVDETP